MSAYAKPEFLLSWYYLLDQNVWTVTLAPRRGPDLVEVKQGEEGITLCQSGYAACILEKMGLSNCNPTHTPMELRLKLSKHSQAEQVDPTEYRSVVGSIRYLLHTQPEIGRASCRERVFLVV